MILFLQKIRSLKVRESDKKGISMERGLVILNTAAYHTPKDIVIC